MPDKTEFRLMLAEDRNSVTLETVVNDQPLAFGTFTDAEQLDGFIAILGAIRGGMNDQIPQTLDPMPRLRVAEHPNWWVFDPRLEGRTLALRHPQFGWLGFLFSPERADEIAEWLKKPYQPPASQLVDP
jgi:hypothetical protein